MVNFSHLLKKPAGQAKRPEALPVGEYFGVIKGFELGDANKNKTPYVRFSLGLMGWPEGGEAVDGIDLSKRSLRRDYFLTEDSLWRLDQFIKSCGLDVSGQTYEEIFPQLVGQQIIIEVQQYVSQNSGEAGNQVGKLIGPEGLEG